MVESATIQLGGENIDARVETRETGRTLVLEVELDPDQPQLTSTGLSHMIAKTGGWAPFVVGGVRYKINLNVVRPLGVRR